MASSTETKTYPSDLIVMLDIDETMICSKHSLLDKEKEDYKNEKEDKKPNNNGHDNTNKKGSNKNNTVVDVLEICGGRHVYVRPKLQEFLSKVATTFETHIYTAASMEYAKNVAKSLDPKGLYFAEDRIWCNKHCFTKFSPPGEIYQYKDLSRLPPFIGRGGLDRVVLIDDYFLNTEMNRSNVIEVKEFDGTDPNDNVLESVQKFLFDVLKDCDDVRPILKAKNEKEFGPPFEFWPWWYEAKEYRGDE